MAILMVVVRNPSQPHPEGESRLTPAGAFEGTAFRDTYAGPVQIRWAPAEEITPLGQLPYLIDFLKQAGLFDAFVQDAPLSYASNNRPRVLDLLATLLLAILGGARRYMHVNVPRHDPVNSRLLGTRKVCGGDSVGRAIARMDAQAGHRLALGASREVCAAVVARAVSARHRHERELPSLGNVNADSDRKRT